MINHIKSIYADSLDKRFDAIALDMVSREDAISKK